MSATNDPNARLLASEYELDDNETLPTGPLNQHSPYHLPPGEQLRGLANRIIFSRYYILFYFIMMSLSLTTVILSLVATSMSKLSHQNLTKGKGQCPPWAWNVLEVVINLMMVAEVSLRWTAYGKVNESLFTFRLTVSEISHDFAQRHRSHSCPLLRNNSDRGVRESLRGGRTS